MRNGFDIHEPDPQKRVAFGKLREAQIANALRDQIGLDIRDATDFQDKHRKIDRWIQEQGKRTPLQIKFRQKGDDLLFEVYDKFFGFNDRGNKVGRDMIGDATMYAVLLSDGKTIKMVRTEPAKDFIWEMVATAERAGWTRDGYTKTLIVPVGSNRAELKLQHDPGDGRPKMVAYIPPRMFDGPTYTVNLPQRWAA